jgi:hypothetical protein
MDPDTQAAIALINPTMGKQLQESRDAQVKTLQLQAQGHINDLETVRNAANPGALVMANPGFRAQWATMAPHFGIDPNDPTQMTPANVQAVFGALANQTRGQVGLPAQKYEQFGPMQTGAAGEKYQVESGSGKVNQVSGEALKQVVGPNGLPQYATADQAAGRQPFNPTIFGAANMSDNTVDTLAAMARANGGKLPASLARNPLMQAKVLERMADQAKANGEDGAAIVYAGNARKANAGALDNLTKLQTATNAYSDTLDKNLSSLLSAAKAAGGTGSPLVNRALRAYQQNVAGDPDTQQMVTYLNAVESEYAKLSSGSLGNAPISDAAKKDAKNVINSALTQGGFEAVADAMRREAQNKKDAYAAQISDLQGKLGASPSQQGATQSAAKPASQQGGGLPRVSSPADLAGLKSGDHFLGPDGIERVKH